MTERGGQISHTHSWSERVFREVYARYINPIRSYIVRRVGNRDDAEDLAAEAFARALKHLDQKDPESPEVAAWLFTAARNLSANYHRARRRIVATVSIEELPEVAETTDAESKAILEDDLDRLVAAIQRLPEPKRRAVVLRFLHELPHAAVAEELGQTEGSARVLVHRAVEQLRREVS